MPLRQVSSFVIQESLDLSQTATLRKVAVSVIAGREPPAPGLLQEG
jgi:hypothetical protein